MDLVDINLLSRLQIERRREMRRGKIVMKNELNEEKCVAERVVAFNKFLLLQTDCDSIKMKLMILQ